MTSKFVVGCPTGYQMRVDYSWNFQVEIGLGISIF